MIAEATFTRKVRDLFRRGASLALRPLTVLAGDNGCGKSTFLRLLGKAASGEPGAPLSLRLVEPRLERTVAADFEHDNIRTSRDGGIAGVFSNLSTSHGEAVMDAIVHDCAGLERALVLLDEPDQCLSPRSAYRAFGVLRRLVEERGCQVVLSCHSVPFMEEAGEVLDLERMRWTPFRDFLASQREPAPLRWVDADPRFAEYVVLCRLYDGRELYWAGSAGGFPLAPPGFTKGSGRAYRFRTEAAAQRKAASLAGRQVRYHEWGEERTCRVASAGAVPVVRAFG